MASTSFPQKEESFPYPLGVNVADSFTLRLCPTNYFSWKQQMLGFLESYKLRGFVDGTINPRKKPPPLLSEEEQETREKERQEDWNQQHMQEEVGSLSLEAWVYVEEKKKELHRSSEVELELHKSPEVELELHKSPEEQERWKEWRRREEWRREPERRRERAEEEHLIYRSWKRSDDLVRRWILATVREELLPHVTHLATAREVWIELGKMLTPPFQLSHPELIDWKDQEIVQIVSKYEVLYKAALTADWDTAAKFLGQEPDAVSQPITWCLETALIVAVRSAKRNHFVKKVMVKMHPKDVAQQDISGATALHAAVDGGNIEAARWLVNKSPELANIGDKDGTLAVHVAAGLGNREMVDFLLEHTWKLSETESAFLLHSLASSELYDIALEVLQGNPELASMKPSPLLVLAEKPTSFLSGTNFNLSESLIYSVIPLKLEDIAYHPQKGTLRIPLKKGTLQTTLQKGTLRPKKGKLRPKKPKKGKLRPKKEPDIENQEREIETQERDIENSIPERDIETQERDIANDPPEPENPTSEWEIGNPCKCCKDCCECIVSALIHVRHKLCSVVGVHCFQKLTAWDVAEKLVPHIKSIRETKLKHYQAFILVKCLIEEVVKKTELRSAKEIFTETVRMATCLGIHEIVEEIWGSFPWAKHLSSEKYRSLFHLAIEYRQENVFNLIYQMEEKPDVILSMPDALKNNALHLAGNLRPQQQILLRASVAGAALQMQRELQWFEEVGNFILARDKKQTNEGRQTPQELFTETHKDLVKDGEQWMKDTANSCTIVAALITTIVFAAAITVPGGSFSDSNFDKKGLPIRLGSRAFTVFSVSDALAMFSSSASLLMFLSILTCRYGEEDFRYSLPRRLIIGLVTLFLSIISMMVAFGATLKIVFGEKTAWLLYPVAALSCAPVALFALWQFPLLYAMIKSTYFPGIFGKKSNRILH